MENTLTSVANISTTKFDSEICLNPKQFSEYWDLFPFRVRKSLNKTKRGELPVCSDDQLKKILDNYLNQDERRISTGIECSE
jgi:hypothetical protein